LLETHCKTESYNSKRKIVEESVGLRLKVRFTGRFSYPGEILTDLRKLLLFKRPKE
jgi:hypothetical protein